MIFGILNLQYKKEAFPVPLEKIVQGYSYPFDLANSEKCWQSSMLTYFIKYPLHLKDNISIAHHENSYSLMAWASLDNKVELFKKLGLIQKENLQPNSANLILQAYIKWGKECVKYLLGDWVFALWDKQRKKLFLAKDHFGHSSLYYFQNNGYLTFSSSLKALLALPGYKKSLNPNAILQLGQGYAKDCQTFYKGIYQIPCGHHLSYSNYNIQLEPYWLPTEVPTIRYKREEDYVDHFFELYQEAVKCRIGSKKVGIALSSGLDSGSIAALAAPIFAQEDRLLQAFTWKPNIVDNPLLREDNIPDEVPLTQELIQHLGPIKMNVVKGKYNNIQESINTCIDVLQEPFPIHDHFYEILQSAKQMNIRTLLTGDLGNATISFLGNHRAYFKSLLSNSYGRGIIQDINKWKSAHQKSWSYVFGLFIYDILFSPVLQPIRNRRLYYLKTQISREYISPHAINQHKSHYKQFTPNIEKLRIINQGNRIGFLLGHLQSNRFGMQKTIFNHFGMEESCPAADKRIIEFCLGIPASQYIGSGQGKFLLKRALKNKIPDKILFSKKSGLQCSNWLSKYRSEAKDIHATFETLKKSELAGYWLNFPLLNKAIENLIKPSTKLNRDIYFLSIRAIKGGLTLGKLLQQLEKEL